MAPIEVSPASVLVELDKILMSPVFFTAGRPSRLLRFLVQETIDGRADSLKEYTLGTSVLGRQPSFDPRIDPIARVEAARLRDRLDLYYATEGRADSVVISLPKGGYVPAFGIRAPEDVLPLAAPIPISGTAARVSWHRMAAVGALVAALLAMAGVTTYTLLHSRAPLVSSLRMSIDPPANTSIGSFALSPDGARIVIAATLQNTSSLFVRPLNSFAYQPLSGTDGAWNPFWSPDGRSVAFFTLGNLKVVEIATGSVRNLCEAVLGRGGAWSSSGEIVFASGAAGPLYKIPASGGKPVAITSLDSSSGLTSHRWPQFLPDGRHFLYFASAYGSESGIDIGDLDSADSRRVVAADTGAAYTSGTDDGSGRLLFVRHGALISQSFDPAQFRTVGEPVTVSPDVNYEPLSRSAQFSVSENGVLAYIAGSPFNQALTLVDRQGVTVRQVGEVGIFNGLHLSADGASAILNRTDPDFGNPSVWSADLKRGSLSRLTSGAVDFAPIWSPDATRVVFARAVSAERGMTLSQVPASGGSVGKLRDIIGAGFPSDWSANGRYLAYTGYGLHGDAGIYILPFQHGEAGEPWPYLQTEHNEGGATFSPAKGGAEPAWIAYTSDQTGRNEVYIQSFPKGGTMLQVSLAGGRDAQWSTDAGEMYFVAPDDYLMSVEIRISPKLEARLPKRMFRMDFPQTFGARPNYADYAPAKNGGQFLVSRTVAGPASSISLVTNWMATVRRK